MIKPTKSPAIETLEQFSSDFLKIRFGPSDPLQCFPSQISPILEFVFVPSVRNCIVFVSRTSRGMLSNLHANLNIPMKPYNDKVLFYQILSPQSCPKTVCWTRQDYQIHALRANSDFQRRQNCENKAFVGLRSFDNIHTERSIFEIANWPRLQIKIISQVHVN